MKNAIIPIILVLAIMGAAYYYLVVMPKKANRSMSDSQIREMPTAEELELLGYNEDEVKAIITSEAYKTGTLINY